MGLSLITSLYRSSAHLPLYMQRVTQYARDLDAQGIPLEMVLVANDATAEERAYLAKFTETKAFEVQVLYVERETLYASWNRGIAAATFDNLGVWNVDDLRLSKATIAAYQSLEAGAEIVDAPYKVVSEIDGSQTVNPPYQPENINPKRCMTAFSLFRRSLYERAGSFNEHFKIAGDFEWSSRHVVRQSKYVQLDTIGGHFILHGGNLSNGTHPLEWVEINVVYLWHGLDKLTRPVEVALMQQVWQDWGHEGGAIEASTAQWLWGDGAQQRYEAYTREREQHPLLRRVRLALARRGLMHSVEWDVHHR